MRIVSILELISILRRSFWPHDPSKIRLMVKFLTNQYQDKFPALCFVLCTFTNGQVVYSCEKEVHSYCGGHVEATSNPTFLSSPGGELVMVVVVMVFNDGFQ